MQVKVEDIRRFDNGLPDKIISQPTDWMSAFEKAATDVYESSRAGGRVEGGKTNTVQVSFFGI